MVCIPTLEHGNEKKREVMEENGLKLSCYIGALETP